jgi:hypothetical protein
LELGLKVVVDATVDFLILSVSEEEDISTSSGLVATMDHFVGEDADGDIVDGNRNPFVGFVATRMVVNMRGNNQDKNIILLTIL